MRFKMLGPLEVTASGRQIELGGSKQRAALGFLLLQPNQVVPTSQLLKALWSVEEAPATARKILQNAVWGLRRALSVEDEPGTPVALRTQAPGYLLEVAPEDVDLHLFRQWVAEGRARLAAGAPEEAARLLRDALDLWRGDVLSDLVEVGFFWSELTTVQNARLDILEDLFDAQLACGRHYGMLGELEAMVESEPLRERSCGQLMRALYRCGRQADALGVYSRLRRVLVEDLGLEPSRELQTLQQAILLHDPALQQPEPAELVTTSPRPRPERQGRQAGEAGQGEQGEQAGRGRHMATPAPSALPAPSTLPTPPVLSTPSAPPVPATLEAAPYAPPASTAVAAVRKEVSVLLVRAELGPDSGVPGGEEVDTALDRMSSLIREQVEALGGTVAASMGTVSLGLFPARDHPDGHAERAVRAAMELRKAFACGPEATGQLASLAGCAAVSAAVSTGEALVREGPDGGAAPLQVSGALLQECQILLSLVPEGEIQVGPTTRNTTGSLFSYTQVQGTPARWTVERAIPVEDMYGAPQPVQDVADQSELNLLKGLLAHGSRWAQPHLVTLRGGSDDERGRILTEFRRVVVAEDPQAVQVLCWCTPSMAESGPFELHRMILSGYCGITRADSPLAIRDKVETTVRRLVGDQGRANWLVARLIPFVDPASRPTRGFGDGEWREGWHQFLEVAARDRPLVLIVDDVQLADETRDLVESIARLSRRVPLLAVAGVPDGARGLSADQAAGRVHATTIALDPLRGPESRRSAESPSLTRDVLSGSAAR
ncbi:BTAD domain-containing putative transcriptional regulator [Streptomyces apocyni]|uniref:BTAD domain-containing putative transcriptional regulator n=1 Tax=Streptomyces apocyni TaxID=2654677 RepID=UPI0012EA8815|nr:BTAD domain-containing putative transcriptional regulator [Streptomyces apocyni]